MPKKPTNPSSQDQIPPENRVVVDLVKMISKHTKEHGSRIQGQCSIEMPKRLPVVCMYASYPSGDYLCWFNDGAYFKMYALVNENLLTVLECPNTELGELQKALSQIQSDLEQANPPEHTGSRHAPEAS